ncbi:MAG: hypothetical protein J0H86_02575 [Xanthomonadaceae bacterium]|nr:hypothetical protein [Xanthomonadaceae bacterium]
MPITKPESEFEPSSVGANARCWQIDNDRLPPPMGNGELELLFAEALVDLAESHEISTLTCFFYLAPSVEFGYAGHSVWIALSGSGPLVKAAGDILQEMIPADFIRGSIPLRDVQWRPRIRIAEGKVWIPYDGAEWSPISATDDTSRDVDEEASAVVSAVDESGRMSARVTPRRRKKILNSAQDDVRVGYYQRKIERLLSLPEGSVKFVNPDRSISHPAQLIGSLRSRWEDA